MEYLFNNDEYMRLSGLNYFNNLKNYQIDFSDIKGFDKLFKQVKRDMPNVSDEAKRIYKNLLSEQDGRELKNLISSLCDAIDDYRRAREIAKINTLEADASLNKNYTFADALDSKQKKKLKNSIKDTKAITELFDPVHKLTKKYALWCLLLCVVAPPAVVALSPVIAIVLSTYVGNESMKQMAYRNVTKQLDYNGKNKYKNMHYSNGYKKLEELTATEISGADLMKSIMDYTKNKDKKDNKDATKKFNEVMDKFVKQSQA
ncbi:MAG: hypothetical protein IJZ29_04860 [Clostridia bacterium]|nr:hypothetical protein [Clostridia bacterium]